MVTELQAIWLTQYSWVKFWALTILWENMVSAVLQCLKKVTCHIGTSLRILTAW